MTSIILLCRWGCPKIFFSSSLAFIVSQTRPDTRLNCRVLLAVCEIISMKVNRFYLSFHFCSVWPLVWDHFYDRFLINLYISVQFGLLSEIMFLIIFTFLFSLAACRKTFSRWILITQCAPSKPSESPSPVLTANLRANEMLPQSKSQLQQHATSRHQHLH